MRVDAVSRCAVLQFEQLSLLSFGLHSKRNHGTAACGFPFVRYGCIEVYYCMVHPSNAGNMFQHPSAPNKAGVSARSAACCSEPGELFKAAAQCKNG